MYIIFLTELILFLDHDSDLNKKNNQMRGGNICVTLLTIITVFYGHGMYIITYAKGAFTNYVDKTW